MTPDVESVEHDLVARPRSVSEIAGWRAPTSGAVRVGARRQPEGRSRQRRSIIGDDDREPVTATADPPWRSICHLEIVAADDSTWIGTGWLAGPRLVVTAGHCVYLHQHGGFVRSVVVSAGRDAARFPFGSEPAVKALSVDGWTAHRRDADDYGALLLRGPGPGSPALGERAGYFGFASLSDAELESGTLNLAGYPRDRTPSGSLWWHSGGTQRVERDFFTYLIDTGEHQSGSPVWRKVGAERRVVGIHTGGGQHSNRAVRIRSAVFDQILDWRKA